MSRDQGSWPFSTRPIVHAILIENHGGGLNPHCSSFFINKDFRNMTKLKSVIYSLKVALPDVDPMVNTKLSNLK